MMNDELITGDPKRAILRFSIPLLLSAVLQQFYSLIDTAIIGKFLGKEALAGVGATGSINFLVLGFCIGIAMGFVIPVAQEFGARDYESMRRYMANGVLLTALILVLMTLVVCLNCRNILLLMNTPDNILDSAYDYIFIIFLGMPITTYYNLVGSFIRSLGDSKSPFYVLLASSVVNIGADIITVTVLQMGIKGPAYATLLSQLFSVLACMYVLKKNYPDAIPDKREWTISLGRFKTLLLMGIPMGLQYSITAIGSVLLQTGTNSLGSDAVAAVAAAAKGLQPFASVTDALGSTMATYAGQNLGAGKPERIRMGVKEASKINIAYNIFCVAIITFFGRFIICLFVDSSETGIVNDGYHWLQVNTAFFFFLGCVNIFRLTIQGMGYSFTAIIAGILEMFARSLVGVVLVPVLGFTGVCFGNCSAWISATLFLIPTYLYVVKREEKRCKKDAVALN